MTGARRTTSARRRGTRGSAIDDAHPDLRPVLERVPRLTLAPWGIPLARFLAGRAGRGGPGAGVEVLDRVVTGGAVRAVEVRLYRPTGAPPVGTVVWVHGGGYVLGTHHDDAWGTWLVRSGAAVVSVGYRLAPRHPFPAALDDVMVALRWAADGGEGLLDGSAPVLAGESAGGGLAAAAAQRAHDEGPDVRGQLLVYPMLDDRTAVRADVGRTEHLVWNRASNVTGWTAYLGAAPGGAVVPPHAVPARRAELAGLPPTWLGVGDLDLFLDEDVAYAQRLRAAGVPCALEVVPGAPHGFPGVAPDAPVSRRFVDGATDWLSDLLATTPDGGDDRP